MATDVYWSHAQGVPHQTESQAPLVHQKEQKSQAVSIVIPRKYKYYSLTFTMYNMIFDLGLILELKTKMFSYARQKYLQVTFCSK